MPHSPVTSLQVAKLNADATQLGARAKAAGHYPSNRVYFLCGPKRYQHRYHFLWRLPIPNDNRTEEGSTFSIRLDVPIYSGSRISGERRQAYEQSMQNRELYLQAQRDTIQATRSLHLSIMTDVAKVKARKQADFQQKRFGSHPSRL